MSGGTFWAIVALTIINSIFWYQRGYRAGYDRHREILSWVTER